MTKRHAVTVFIATHCP